MADPIELLAATLVLLLAAGSLGGSLYLIVRARRWRGEVDHRPAGPRKEIGPPASLILPVRGDFASLEANLRALLQQAYADLEVVFTADSRGDSLFASLEALAREAGSGRTKVVAVEDRPAPPAASGKCAAHLRALEAVRRESEVLVFADDDIRPAPSWLASLLAPLEDPGVAVATAYRWYFSSGGGLASHIRAAWNLVGLQIMFDPTWNFAWGGGMAIRRADFDRWDIAAGWHHAISDDYVVTIAAKKDGRRIEFVPGALAPSFETVDRPKMLEWCRRQTFMTKIYDPRLWKFAVAPYLFFNTTMLLGAAVLAAAAAGALLPWWALLASAAFVLHFPLNLAKAAIFYGGVRRMMPAHETDLRALYWPYLAGAALAPFVIIYALLSTRDLSVIEWRGRRYEVKGPLDVRPL